MPGQGSRLPGWHLLTALPTFPGRQSRARYMCEYCCLPLSLSLPLSISLCVLLSSSLSKSHYLLIRIASIYSALTRRTHALTVPEERSFICWQLKDWNDWRADWVWYYWLTERLTGGLTDRLSVWRAHMANEYIISCMKCPYAAHSHRQQQSTAQVAHGMTEWGEQGRDTGSQGCHTTSCLG